VRRRDFLARTAGTLAAAAVSGCRTPASIAGSAPVPALVPVKLDAAAFRDARRFTQLRYGRIVHVERGRGPAALFIHGYPLNGYQWRGALERLAPYRRCISPDLMGLGYSEVPATQDLSPSAQAEMLAALLDALGVDAVDLVANDSGNAIAQLFLVRYPSRVRTILFTNGDVHENSPPAKLRSSIELAQQGRYADERLLPQLRDPELARSAKGIGGGAYTNPANFTDESIEYYFAPLVSTPLRKAQVNQYAVAFDPNPLVAIEPQLRRSTQPVRMVWGTGDQLFPVSWAEWLHRTMPGSRGVRLVEGAKLFFPEEMPDLIAEEARALWQ
jgi:haloalkane dehalogenase